MLSGWHRRVHYAVRVLGLALAGVAASANSGFAQATSQIPLQFNFMTPGARSLGMGGAFLGAADDATTASANPAGLASLSLREVSAEVRYQRMETPFLRGGRISGVATGLGLDTVTGPIYGTDVDRQGAIPFVSLVLPFSRATLGVYRHEVARMENALFSQGVFQRVTFGGVADDRARELPLAGTRTIAVSSYGAALGVPLGPRLSAGGGLALYTWELDSHFARLNVGPTIFDAAVTSAVTATAVQEGDGVTVAPNVGVVWQAHTGLRVGGQFRRGPRFSFTQADDIPLNEVHVVRDGHFKVPDVTGVGVEWRLAGRDDQGGEPAVALRVLFDYMRVQYSQLEADFVDMQALTSGRPEQLTVDDGNEVHGGAEVILLRWRGRPLGHPVFLRGGAWFDPDHAVRYVPTAAHDQLDVLLSATLPGGRNLTHYTVGGGVVLPHRIELNGAVDVSSHTTYATTSVVVRF